jgi:4-hydroxybenzoate polyprenyltransferase
VLTLNPLTVQFAVAGAVVTVLYPFTKRFLSTPQFVLGIAFSWGVPMAFAATVGDVPRVGWLLFLSTVIWVVVYDTQYAMTDRADDLKVGVRSTAILFGDLDRAFIAGLQALLLVSLVLVGRSAELGLWYYGGLAVAALLSLYQSYLIKDRDIVQSFRAFLNNAWLGGAVFAGIVLDYTFRG